MTDHPPTPAGFNPNEPVPGWTIEGHLAAYANGFFPMADHLDGEVYWYKPVARAVLPLTEADGLHVPRTIARVLRQRRFSFTTDEAFEQVIRCCANRPDDPMPWLDERVIAMFLRLHDAGHAHSLEAWRTDTDSGRRALVGGIYGLSIGAAFFAESMCHTHRPPRDGVPDPLDGTNASSACLVTLARHLRECGYALLDVQVANDHTARFGVRELDNDAFQDLCARSIAPPDRWRPIAREPAGPSV